MAINIILHEANNLLRESDVMIPHKCLAALHSIDDTLYKVLVNEEALCVLRNKL